MDLKVGDEVTVVVDANSERPRLVRTRVSSIITGRPALMVVSELVDSRYLYNEGISWCRGHSGPDVDALKVALALR
jgi:hypothetical protein